MSSSGKELGCGVSLRTWLWSVLAPRLDGKTELRNNELGGTWGGKT